MNWGYVAGFLDGEGSITVSAVYYKQRRKIYTRVQVSFYQKNPEALLEIAKFLSVQGCHSVKVLSGEVRTNVSKEPSIQHRLCISNVSDLVIVLRGMIPELVIKKNLAERALELLHSKYLEKELQ
jgi:hypothetical protein